MGEDHLVTLQTEGRAVDDFAARRPYKIYWGVERVEGVKSDSFSDTCRPD